MAHALASTPDPTHRAAVERPLRPRFGSPMIAPWVEQLSASLDSRYRVPIVGWRFGIDGLIGLVPVIGDLLSAAYGAVIVFEAFRLRLSLATVSRMLGNLAADAALGSVPVVGDAIDFFYKPNERNLRLLQAALERSGARSKPRTIEASK